MRTDEDLLTIVTVIFLGMAVPLVLALLLHDVLELYLTGRQLTYLAAVGYTLVFWGLLARYDLDRVNVAIASIVFPVVGIVLILFTGIAMTNLHEGFQYLFLDVDDLFVYAVTFGTAGIAAVALQQQTERLAGEYDRVPTPQTIPLGLLVILALGLLAAGTVGHVTASAAEISTVGPDATRHGKPVLNVTVDSEPTELRLTVTAPDDSTTTHRITRTELQDGTATVPIEFWEFDDSEPQTGTYTVSVTGLPGLTVDTATYTIESAPSPTLVGTATAPAGEALDLPADTDVYGSKDDTETRVAVVLQNEGDVAARFYVQIYTENDRIRSREIPIGPRQQGAIVFELSEEDVDRIHAEANGTLTVEINYADERIMTTVELPES